MENALARPLRVALLPAALLLAAIPGLRASADQQISSQLDDTVKQARSLRVQHSRAAAGAAGGGPRTERGFGTRELYAEGAVLGVYPGPKPDLAVTVSLKLHSSVAKDGDMADRLAIFSAIHRLGLDIAAPANDERTRNLEFVGRLFSFEDREDVFQLDDRVPGRRDRYRLSIVGGAISLARVDGQGPVLTTTLASLRELRLKQLEGKEVFSVKDGLVQVLGQGGAKPTLLCFPVELNGRLIDTRPGEVIDGACRLAPSAR